MIIESDTKSCSLVWSPDSKKLAIAAWYETIVVNLETKERISKVEISGWNQHGCCVIHPEWFDNNTLVGKWDKFLRVVKFD